MRKAVRFFPLVPAIIFLIPIIGSFMSAQTGLHCHLPANRSPTRFRPTVAEATEFIRQAEARLNDLTVKASRASWVQSNFITDDTQQMAADANEGLIGATTELAKQATRFDHLKLSEELTRKMLLLKLSAAVPALRPMIPKNSLSWHASVHRWRPTTVGQVLPQGRQARR